MMTPGFTTPRQKKVTGESEHPCKSNESRILYVSMILPFGGFHHGGTPYSWMVFVRENPIYKWMMTGGSPICGHPHLNIYCFRVCLSHDYWGSKGDPTKIRWAPCPLTPSFWGRHRAWERRLEHRGVEPLAAIRRIKTKLR